MDHPRLANQRPASWKHFNPLVRKGGKKPQSPLGARHLRPRKWARRRSLAKAGFSDAVAEAARR